MKENYEKKVEENTESNNKILQLEKEVLLLKQEIKDLLNNQNLLTEAQTKIYKFRLFRKN